jgi:hypothetical protein
MYLQRNKKNCNIYSSYFINDLKSYEFVEDPIEDTLNLKYEDEVMSTGVFRTDLIKTVIDSHQPTTPVDDIWLPAIIDTSSYVTNKQILMGHVLNSTVFGIENIMSFNNLQFKNWTLSEGSDMVNLSLDWHINSDLSSVQIDHGILCWYKKNTINTSSTTYKISDIPPGTKIYSTQELTHTDPIDSTKTYTLNADEEVIKIDNSTLKLMSASAITANNNQKIFDLSKVRDITSGVYTSNSLIFKISSNTNSVHLNLSDYMLWISNGEAFGYYAGYRDKNRRQNTNLISRSYLSPCLYSIYRSIYHSLTIRQNRHSSGSYNLTKPQLARLKKLCYFLATAPLMDRTTVNYLIDPTLYYTIYSEYILPNNDVLQEKQNLLDIIKTIFVSYKKMSTFLDKQTLSTNYIRSKKDLFTKLIKKYVPSLSIKNFDSQTTAKFDYKSLIRNGSHAYFNFGIRSNVSKTTPNSTVIYNNFILSLGSIRIQTNNIIDPVDFTNNNSECQFKYVNDDNSTLDMTPFLPLSDIALKKPDGVKLDVGDDFTITMGTTEEQKHLIDSTLDAKTGENVGDDILWFLSEGKDCLRFSDLDKYDRRVYFATNGFRLRTSTEAKPTIYVKQSGLYSVDCVLARSSSIRKSDTLDIFVDGGIPVPSIPDPTVITEYKTMCPNIRQIAINKRGLIWFIDTDMFVCEMPPNAGFEKDERCINKKIPLAYFSQLDDEGYQVAKVYHTDADLSFSIIPNNTIVKLSSLSIENLRDRDGSDSAGNSISYASCKSCYDDVIKRERDVPFGLEAEIGNARYYRDGVDSQTSYYKYTTTDNITWSRNRNSPANFSFPTISTAFSPKISSYGGYSQEVINTLGIDIPYHPIMVGGNPVVYDATPAGTVWDGPDGIASSTPAYMPALIDRNDMGGYISNRRCRLKEIPITGCLSFEKGYFHPQSGWYYNWSTEYMDPELNLSNMSSVKKYQTDDYSSYVFKGYGFTDLKSAFDINGNNIDNTFSSQIVISSTATSYSTEHNPNYGFRNPNGYDVRYLTEEVDDFQMDRVEELRGDFICGFTPVATYSFINSSKVDTLKIKDIEVKLNFLNYPNPKNLIVYLEVQNDTMSTVPSTEPTKLFNKYIQPSDLSDSAPNIESYMSAVSGLHNPPWLPQDKKRIYLLNRDSIDNYGYYFSLRFSDNASIFNTTTDYNKISDVICPQQHIVHDGEVLRPSISPTGYSDESIASYRNVFANNNMSLLEASFAKFKEIPLKNTKFTLNIVVVDHHDSVSIKDTVLNNNELAGLNIIENKEISNNISNSLCNWELIVHTSNTKKFTVNDVLGYINYDAPSVNYSGYSFIADLTDKKYMIPPVNINAPFPYISNINSCRYLDDSEAGRSMSYDKIEYPYGFMFFVPFFTIVGSLVAIFELQARLSAGGRGDPIVNMFLDIRYQTQQRKLEAKYFQPVYNAGFGVANKAVILASKDKNQWFQMEVPIFKYDNCPVLNNNKYKYIKLKKNLFLGRFDIKRIKDIKEIIPKIDIAAIITDPNQALSGLTITTKDDTSLVLKEGDLVEVNTETVKAIYYVTSGGWVEAPNTSSEKFLAINKCINNTTLTQAYVKSRQLIMLDGTRAYYFFDKTDSVLIDGIANTVTEKALLLINGHYKTVLTVSSPLDINSGSICKSDTDVNSILIYKDHITKNDNVPVGKWGLNKTAEDRALNFKIHRHPSLVGEGSLGFGTPFIEPELFDQINLKNSIEETKEIFNNTTSNKFRYNSLTITSAADQSVTYLSFNPDTDSEENLLAGYSYSLYDFNLDNDTILVDKNIIDKAQLDMIKSIIASKVTISHDNQNPLFMDLKSDKFKTIADSGEIIIENDYLVNSPMYNISEKKKAILRIRVKQISKDIGQSQGEYDNMPDDPVKCTECPKQNLKQDIKALTTEKNTILNTISKASSSNVLSYKVIIITNIDDTLTDDEIAHLNQYFDLSNEGKTDAEIMDILELTQEELDRLKEAMPTEPVTITIQDKDYYWINLDKEQVCSVAKESSIKILKEVTYTCTPVVSEFIYQECSPVCGNNYSMNINNGTDENIEQSGRKMKYTISQEKITEEKNKYPTITEWVTDSFEKSFFILCKAENGDGVDAKDILVTVVESYELPKNPVATSYKVKDVFNLDSDNTIYIKFKNIPRKLKTIDPAYDVYNYDYNGNLGKGLTVSPNGRVYNNFCVWECFGFNDDQPVPDGDPFYGKQIEPPDFYKLQNEMIFRAFFGSVDGVEFKNTKLANTKEPWEWIPYEYFNKPIIEP